MKIVRCIKIRNHFYDADRYDECPQCNKNAVDHRKRLFFQEASKPLNSIVAKQVSSIDATVMLETPENDATVMLETPQNDATVMLETPENDTTVMLETPQNDATVMLETPESVATVMLETPENDATAMLETLDRDSFDITQKSQTISIPEKSSDVKKNTRMASKERKLVVGWLVVVNGINKGKTYELFSGNNTIGRGERAAINMDSDSGVAPGLQGILTYHETKNIFLIEPNEKMSMIWVNGHPLRSREQLAAYTTVSVGNTEFIFVPLCGSLFSWKR